MTGTQTLALVFAIAAVALLRPGLAEPLTALGLCFVMAAITIAIASVIA